jgi:hypothetical protein
MARRIALPPAPANPENSEYDPFWEWFVSQEAEFYQQLTKAKPPIKTFNKTVQRQIDKIHPDIFCDTAIDATGKVVVTFRHEEVVKNMIFVDTLVINAPKLPNWQFHAFIPPAANQPFRETYGKHTFDSEQLNFYFRTIPECPTETHLVVIYPHYNMADGPTFAEAIKTFILHYVGERIFVTQIDEFYVRRDVSPADKDIATVQPLSQLLDALQAREQEFLDKATEPFTDGEDTGRFSTIETKTPIGTIRFTVNTTLALWPDKFSYPFVMQVNISYEVAKNGRLPGKKSTNEMDAIFAQLYVLLKLEDDCLNLAQVMGGGVYSAFFALRSAHLPSLIAHIFINTHPLAPLMSYELEHDKYWKTLPFVTSVR